MKKIILSAMAFMMLFSCQNDQTESLIQQQNAIASVVVLARSACCTVSC
jgi:hypothetical protein